MKKINKLILSAFAVAVVISSCTVEKRLHNDGYHISWKHKSHVAGKSETESVAENQVKKSDAKGIILEKHAVADMNQQEPAELPVAVQSTIENAAVTEKLAEKPAHKAAKTAFETEKMVTNAATQHEKGAAFTKAAVKKIAKKSMHEKAADDELILLYILCVLIPFVAVGIVTDWALKPVLISILLSILCIIPGIIHAFITVGKNR